MPERVGVSVRIRPLPADAGSTSAFERRVVGGKVLVAEAGQKKGFTSKKTGGLSNKEKKKNQPFSMIRKSSAVKGKARHREDHARADARRAKKMFKGRVKRGAA